VYPRAALGTAVSTGDCPGLAAGASLGTGGQWACVAAWARGWKKQGF